MRAGAQFIRVSTGSQDETSQGVMLDAEAEARGIQVVKRFVLHGYSASHGTQEPALREAIADMERGDYSVLMVTESSRLDRHEDLDAQAEILLAVRAVGGEIISVAEPQFGHADFAGRIVTLVAQHANAEKSKVVKQTTYRGIMVIAANKGFRGPLPALWSIRGQRYRKQAFCADPERVRAIYERVAEGGSVAKVAREFNLYPVSVRGLVRFEANHTGVIECRYSYRGVTETWTHEVEPVVDSPLWWRANKALKANKTPARANKGGRPVAQSDRWISGLLDCPACGGRLYLNEGMTAAGNPRTARLRCGGQRKVRVMCRVFTGCDAQPMIDTVEAMFAGDSTPILAFQRIAGNTHELDGLRASLAKIQARLSATEDDDELDALVAQRKRAKAAVEDFKIVPDSFDYAPTGQTVAGMWAGDDTVKRGMVAAVKRAWGLALTEHEGQ